MKHVEEYLRFFFSEDYPCVVSFKGLNLFRNDVLFFDIERNKALYEGRRCNGNRLVNDWKAVSSTFANICTMSASISFISLYLPKVVFLHNHSVKIHSNGLVMPQS